MRTRIKLLVVLMSVTALVVVAGNAFALTGSCVDCHTMHNSQDGATVSFDGSANEMLLMAGSCGGCHADAAAAAAIDGVPQVNLSASYSAGGSFYWVADDDATGHNVSDLSISEDVALSYDPPGFDENLGTGVNGGAADWATQLTCAGTNGCHGTHDTTSAFDAVKGAHHGNAGGILDTADTTGNSYRFLTGIKGGEDADWELNTSVTDHNVYYGNARTDTIAVTDTISALCAQCHGHFHNAADITSAGGDMSSPWIRHPSDIDMRAVGGEYAAYVYDVEAPAALSTLVAPTSTAYDSEAIVTCISCHRAHGSENADLLRWAYSGMEAGTTGAAAGTGCFRCHTTKDGI